VVFKAIFYELSDQVACRLRLFFFLFLFFFHLLLLLLLLLFPHFVGAVVFLLLGSRETVTGGVGERYTVDMINIFVVTHGESRAFS